MKALKISGIVIGSIVCLVIIVAGIIWFMMSRPSAIASKVTPVASSPQAAQQLDAKWTDFEKQAKQAAPGATVSVALTQEEVNSKINEELKNVDLPDGLAVSNVNVNLVDGKILMSANVNYSLFSGNAGLEATIENVNGTAKLVVQDVDMGSLPIPDSLKDQLKDLIPEDSLIQSSGLPISMRDIEIIDGQIVIKGVRQ